TKTESPNPGTVNNPITYTLVVHDNGPSDAQSVTVTDSLPAGVTFVSATSSQGTVGQSGGVVTGHLGALANAGTATITIIVTPTGHGTLNDSATVGSSPADANSANHT